jgi:uncharacterized protein (TIGR00369 family)
MRRLNPEYVRIVADTANQCPFFSLLSMKIVTLEIGTCRIEIEVAEKHFQPFGIVHGGAFCSIIDAAAFWAVFSEVSEGEGMTSVDVKMNYLAPSAGGKLIAIGNKIRLGKTLGLGEAQVTDEQGKILAHGTSTLMVLPGLAFGSGAELPRKFLD